MSPRAVVTTAVRHARRALAAARRRVRPVEGVPLTVRTFDPPRLVRSADGSLVRVRYPLLDAPVTGTVPRVRWLEDRPGGET